MLGFRGIKEKRSIRGVFFALERRYSSRQSRVPERPRKLSEDTHHAFPRRESDLVSAKVALAMSDADSTKFIPTCRCTFLREFPGLR